MRVLHTYQKTEAGKWNAVQGPLRALKPSPHRRDQKAAELKPQGKDCDRAGAGEPDFDTPHEHQGRARIAASRGQDKLHRR